MDFYDATYAIEGFDGKAVVDDRPSYFVSDHTKTVDELGTAVSDCLPSWDSQTRQDSHGREHRTFSNNDNTVTIELTEISDGVVLRVE
jgi:hypothetical protein